MVETKFIEVALTPDAPFAIFENDNGSSVTISVTALAAGEAIIAVDASNFPIDEYSQMPVLPLIRLGTNIMSIIADPDETALHGALDIISKISQPQYANDYIVIGAKNCRKIGILGAVGGTTPVVIRACTE